MSAATCPLSNMGRAALRYAERGLVLFPQYPSRAACFAGWLEKATSDPAVLADWWQTWPDANPACVLGRSGLLVVDVDVHPGSPDGFAALAALEERHGALPATAVTTTGGGGAHYWFRAPRDGARCCTIAPSVEIKAGRIGVPLPPARHRRGGRYIWKSTSPVADLRESWAALVAAAPSAPPRAARKVYGMSPRYGRTAIENECAAVAGTPDGCGRNGRLWIAACRLGGLVPGAFVHEDEAAAALLEAARAAGMPERKSLDTIQRGLRTGATRPRVVGPRSAR